MSDEYGLPHPARDIVPPLGSKQLDRKRKCSGRMKRPQFMALLGVTAALSFAAQAQQSRKVCVAKTLNPTIVVMKSA